MKIPFNWFIKTVLILIVILTTMIFLKNRVTAQNASNNFYMIQGGEIEQKTESSDKSYDKTTNIYPGENFQVITGFEDIENRQPFSFSVSDSLIDYGPLTPTNPVSRTTELNFSKGSSRGYSVFAFQDRQLSDVNNNSIPDTTCDNGTCSEISSGVWTSNLSFGFGYRCENADGSICTEDFSKADYFKQFANDSRGEQHQSIINGFDSKKAKIEFKLNISGSQPKGSYFDTITFIAVPNL